MTVGGFGGAAQGGATQLGGGGGGALGTAGGFGGGGFGISGRYGGVGCPFGEKELGMENGKIQDDQITSSSDWNKLPAKNGRLNGSSCWAAGKNDKNQWIQVDFEKPVVVTKIATQGRGKYDQWVKSYTVSYSLDGNNFKPYQVDGVDKVRISVSFVREIIN